MQNFPFNPEYYRGRRVFVTGHTGFKGAWLCHALSRAGAFVTGFALPPEGEHSLFDLAGVGGEIRSVIGDIRDLAALKSAFDAAKPEFVFHLAAQPIVRESYRNPVYTYEANVMGTVNLLECVRLAGGVRSVLNVTTDKVYQNNEWCYGYRECDALDGYDPYSNSKSCSELVTHSYARSFLTPAGAAVSTARAGNVIGGGDFAQDRILPDCIRAAMAGREIIVRNPHSTRPYQHVLEPIFAYMMIAAAQAEDAKLAGSYNVGPDDADCFRTGDLCDLFVEAWGEGARWVNRWDGGPHEANFLKLDCSKLKQTFGWRPVWNLRRAVEATVEWTRAWIAGEDLKAVMNRQIDCFCGRED